MDNVISTEFKKSIETNGITYQLVPPNDHRQNAAEKAIHIFKDNFVSVLCRTDITFSHAPLVLAPTSGGRPTQSPAKVKGGPY